MGDDYHQTLVTSAKKRPRSSPVTSNPPQSKRPCQTSTTQTENAGSSTQPSDTSSNSLTTVYKSIKYEMLERALDENLNPRNLSSMYQDLENHYVFNQLPENLRVQQIEQAVFYNFWPNETFPGGLVPTTKTWESYTSRLATYMMNMVPIQISDIPLAHSYISDCFGIIAADMDPDTNTLGNYAEYLASGEDGWYCLEELIHWDVSKSPKLHEETGCCEHCLDTSDYEYCVQVQIRDDGVGRVSFRMKDLANMKAITVVKVEDV